MRCRAIRRNSAQFCAILRNSSDALPSSSGELFDRLIDSGSLTEKSVRPYFAALLSGGAVPPALTFRTFHRAKFRQATRYIMFEFLGQPLAASAGD